MDPNEAQATSERDQLWATLRVLRPQIERLAAGDVQLTDLDKQIVALLARIVVAEMDFRLKEAGGV